MLIMLHVIGNNLVGYNRVLRLGLGSGFGLGNSKLPTSYSKSFLNAINVHVRGFAKKRNKKPRVKKGMWKLDPFGEEDNVVIPTDEAALPRHFFPKNFYFKQLKPLDYAYDIEDPVHRMAHVNQNYIYVLGNKATSEAVVVDACFNPEAVRAIVSRDGLNVVAFVATHYHWDHIGTEDKYG